MKPEEIAKVLRTSFQLLKNAALPDSESVTDTSVFSIIRHWLSLKRHMAYHLLHFGHTLDVLLADELNKLINEGAQEILLAVTHTLENSKQSLENYRRLSALVDGDYDKYLGQRDLGGLTYSRRRRQRFTEPIRTPPRTDLSSYQEKRIEFENNSYCSLL